ncbi:hypothetical protein MJO28_000921 [Puccinia striiformis f. sp. tritici]|uniref:Uncharacterized protein n=1 Tax=Puccinia striiformis f. sp. tritici TaxID=168172 RepID=A0ACC0EZC3_9BASI|nr:hypothetical protein MJO28_000921 [Puccinia striiformis f. sp. tritici]
MPSQTYTTLTINLPISPFQSGSLCTALKVNQSPPCQSESCRLQGCLNRNTYSQEKCSHLLINLYQCCSELYQLDRKQNPSTPASSDSNNPIIKDQILSSVCPLERVIKKKLESS